MDRLSAREYPGAVFTCFHILRPRSPWSEGRVARALGPIFRCPKNFSRNDSFSWLCDSDGIAGGANMKDRTHFGHRLDMYGSGDEVVEHLAGIEDYLLAVATYHAACRRWPDAHLKLRQADRVIADSRQDRPRQ
jgi:hypothetical protein